jgi:hypothetical protein
MTRRRHVAGMGKGELHAGLVGRREGKRPLGRLMHRLENNIKKFFFLINNM